MKFKTIKEADNRLLNRREYIFAVEDIEKTPKREDLLKQISAKMGFDEKKVIVDKIYTSYGTPEVKVYVKVYDSIRDLESIESKKGKKVREKVWGLKKQQKEQQKEPKQEAPQEEPKQGTPQEEPKKEAPKEEAKEEKQE